MNAKLGCSWLVLAASLLLACGDEGGTGGDPTKPTELPSGATCPDHSPLTYANFGQQFFDDYCTRCHDSALRSPDRSAAPAGVNFDALATAKAVGAERIDEYAVKGGAEAQMPREAPFPTEEERRQLGEWLACGMR